MRTTAGKHVSTGVRQRPWWRSSQSTLKLAAGSACAIALVATVLVIFSESSDLSQRVHRPAETSADSAVISNRSILAFGDASFFGFLGSQRVKVPAVDAAVTPDRWGLLESRGRLPDLHRPPRQATAPSPTTTTT